ncbi:hypothetical protein F7725_024352 [Dissostichus mawsoni]|uniref:Uncharacterized protein n=1 Tax=Dissostichus mawsoni TaxID=36200 RepID=A0A7J5XZX8_DISMA|nr:hypothetical protein F7725_024352 [Dissostichus mawsoni]
MKQRGSLAGASQSRGGFAPQLFALQADGLRHHQRRGGEVVRRRLLLMSAVDVTGDEQDLGQQGSHFQSQFLVDREVSRYNSLICLIGQQQPLPL